MLPKLETAILAALEAGREILKFYCSGDFNIEIKSDSSPLTKADTASHNVIMRHLNKIKIPILSEEGSAIDYQERKKWKQLWIVDPLDGTKEFIKRNGEFTVNIALVENQKISIYISVNVCNRGDERSWIYGIEATFLIEDCKLKNI